MTHPLHEYISDLISKAIPEHCTLVMDPACRGDQNIPLFCSDRRSQATEFCNVDLLVLHSNRIRLIVEIEESNVKPTQIAGKFLTSALATHFIHDKHGKLAIPKDDELIFLQFVDTTRLPIASVKPEQWKNLEKSIQSILPLGGIKRYRLFHGDKNRLHGIDQIEFTALIAECCK